MSDQQRLGGAPFIFIMRYWLLKTEPSVFGIHDLNKCPKKTDLWDGIRNYQARNFIRDLMQPGDQAFLYHSRVQEPGIVGICNIISQGYPDPSALNPKHSYFDPKSVGLDAPRWYAMDVQLIQIFPKNISLYTLKKQPELKNMIVLRKGNRLSISPVTASEWKYITKMAH